MNRIWQRVLIIFAVACLCGAASLAQESQLAGVRLGQTMSEVKEMWGSPDGEMIPLPPLEIRSENPSSSSSSMMGGGMMGSTTSVAPPQPVPNMLIFKDYYTKKPDILLGNVTVIPSDSTGGSMGISLSGGETGAEKPALPAWAYGVHSNGLETNQRQYIYRINKTYSIGITFTKRDGDPDYLISDIAICSFEPTGYYQRSKMRINKLNFVGDSGVKRGKSFPAMTVDGIKIGSSFGDVLKLADWTPFIFPFVSGEVSRIGEGISKDVPVESYAVTVNNGSFTVTPSPDLYQSQTTIPGAHRVRFTNGKDQSINFGYSPDCLLLYPDKKLAITLVDRTVVRIQIGNGIVTPPEPPKPIAVPYMDGGGINPIPPFGGGPVTPPPPGGGFDW